MALKFRRMASAALFGSAGIFVSIICQFAVSILLPSFWPYEILTFLMLVCVGFNLTSVTTMAMDEGRRMVGTASAIFGASGFLFGGIVTPLAGIGNILLTTIALIAVCSIFALMFAWMSFRRKESDPR